MVDVEAANISDSELLAQALKNTAQDIARNENAQVKHGSQPVNEYARVNPETCQRWEGAEDDPNHLLAAFPVLFPYGYGGFEVDRKTNVSYPEHVRWALQYSDNRFRHDLQFIFQVFGVILKRKIARAAVVQIERAAYAKHAAAIGRLTTQDFAQASEEEAAKRPFSNPTMSAFRQQISALRSQVMGTDESRREVRAQIWGTTLVHGPPNLWLTLNPSDIHDPLAQVLAGEDIDLDHFFADKGPNSSTRACNIAADPYAAAEFFHKTIQAVLEQLFGITAGSHSGRARIRRKPGVLGTLKSYVGTVEAQFRGMLHLHILLWLDGSPTAQEMIAALKDERFTQKVSRWLGQNITADIGNLGASEIKAMARENNVSFSRPLHTDASEEERLERLRTLARNLQVHDCKGHGCIQRFKETTRCKRGAPFACASCPWIHDTGEWGPKRLYGYVVGYNPAILLCLRCNHDLKLMTNASNAGGLCFYITLYATKKQQKAGNISALLARRFAFHIEQERRDPRADTMNRRLINRCANTLNRDQEFSAPEVISYLMNWGDRYISNTYVVLYWDSMVYHLKNTFPELRAKT